MANNIYNYVNPNDANKTMYRVDQVVSYKNVINGSTALAVQNTNFGGFPNKSNIPINNSNFDLSAGIIRYQLTTVDVGNLFPAAVDYYTATKVKDTFTIPYAPNTTSPSITNYTFNETSINANVTIENCFNHISVIVIGGGGGGGYSYPDDAASGQGGGGGGCCSAHRIALSSTGRSFTVQCGAGGCGGVPANYAYPLTYTNGNNGDVSFIKSNANTSLHATSNGGNFGIASLSNSGTGGSSVVNFAAAEIQTATASTTNNQGSPASRPDGKGTYGGDCVYDNLAGRNTGVIAFLDLSGNHQVMANNQSGVPGGGYYNGDTLNDNVTMGTPLSLANPVTYNRPTNAIGGGGGGAGSSNGSRPGHPGAPGAPGCVIIYKYLV